MEQYISKSAVVAEIKKLMGNPELIEDWRYRVKMEEKNELLKNIINTINTLEVKEMSLEEELPVSNSLTEEGVFTFKDGSQAIITKID